MSSEKHQKGQEKKQGKQENKYGWRSNDPDDYVGSFHGLMLRFEAMDINAWWWAVYADADGFSIHSHEAIETYGFPETTNWRDACLFAQMWADHINRYHTKSLYYLPHVPAGVAKENKPKTINVKKKKHAWWCPDFADVLSLSSFY